MTPDELRLVLKPLRLALRDAEVGPVATALRALVAPDATIHLGYPLNGGTSPAALEAALSGLLAAMPDLERRDAILVAGRTKEREDWVGAMGHYIGTFRHPWLGIPPTGHFAHMRFHEFWRLENGRVVEMQALWDVPELMLQARAWPLAPSLGREGLVLGPATQDGLAPNGPEEGQASRAHVLDMLEAMQRHPAQGGPELMELPRFWHPRMTWYGPAGIGTARGIDGFRRWHQIPFLAAMPDRGQHADDLPSHVFAEKGYVALTGWPNMRQTLTGGGWLGLPPTGKMITLRSLDFWRLEGGLIRENWVLVDLLDVYAQLGLDVLGRMREMVVARV
ncbi:MAG TPA: ester cyclase [Rubellimicrobium sp.]|nr:ester cyclase [Rubellimicrobium sp.]